MNKHEINAMYSNLKMNAEKKEEIYRRIVSGTSKQKTPVLRTAVCAAACLSLLVISIPPLRINAIEMIRSLTYTIISHNGDSVEEQLEEQNVKYHVSLPAVFSSVKDAENAFGIDLLESDDPAAEPAGSKLYYYPYIVPDEHQKDQIAGMSFINYVYACGDLKKLSIPEAISATQMDAVTYTSGERYHSPISMQIRILIDAGLYRKQGRIENIEIREETEDGLIRNDTAEAYTVPSIQTDAMIISSGSDEQYGIGPEIWQPDDHTIVHITSAILTYQGIEYTFSGDVDTDTMKEFLNSLRP